MKHLRILSPLVAGAIMAASTPALSDEDDDGRHRARFIKERVSIAPVGAFPDAAGSPLTPVDGTSFLFRTGTGVAFTLNTRSLAPGSPYTAWWVVFNRPKACLAPYACEGADLSNPEVKPGVYFATGRVADEHGQASFAAELDYGELPEGEDQVPNPARANPVRPKAEIHLVLRSHGPARDDPEGLEAQLSQFNGGCPPNACANVQASVHPSPKGRFR